MKDRTLPLDDKVALVTGGARRIGAAITRALHREGMTIALHFNRSSADAASLRDELEAKRPDSIRLYGADLMDVTTISRLVAEVVSDCGGLDTLVNNASTFFETPLATASEAQWDNLVGTNLKAPFFLAQAAAPHLERRRGCIVNLADIHGQRPLKAHPIYSVAKAGLIMLTRSLARELGPEVRVNAIAPGPILWPAQGLDEMAMERIVSQTALKRMGDPEDIAATVVFLVGNARYVTGQVIGVDGGRTLSA